MKIGISRRALLIGGVAAFLAATVTRSAGIGDDKSLNSGQGLGTFPIDSADWILSDSDYRDYKVLMAADSLVESNAFTLYDQVDYPGSDFKALKVESLSECIEACEGDTICKSFTYAKSTHPRPEKRQMCWLKNANDLKGNKAIHYVSGKRQ